jgi:hypothetical protein
MSSGRQLATFATSVGVALLELRAQLQPSKLIST